MGASGTRRSRRNSTYVSSCGMRKTSAAPSRPILAVRPTLCTNAAGSCGGSYCTIQSTSGMSSPRAARSVHRSTPPALAANAASTPSRCVCLSRPCSADNGRPLSAGARASAALKKSTHAHVRKYTIVFSCGCAWRKATSWSSFSSASHMRYESCSFEGVLASASSAPEEVVTASSVARAAAASRTTTRTGLRRPARASSASSSV
mmetsp:Transcript_4961/g.17245  ORF Transcript_4961/g.17245 Transcript_4961/m.17245 type:complete len:205 (-) Transcript_4961:428-1042(-)